MSPDTLRTWQWLPIIVRIKGKLITVANNTNRIRACSRLTSPPVQVLSPLPSPHSGLLCAKPVLASGSLHCLLPYLECLLEVKAPSCHSSFTLNVTPLSGLSQPSTFR